MRVDSLVRIIKYKSYKSNHQLVSIWILQYRSTPNEVLQLATLLHRWKMNGERKLKITKIWKEPHLPNHHFFGFHIYLPRCRNQEVLPVGSNRITCSECHLGYKKNSVGIRWVVSAHPGCWVITTGRGGRLLPGNHQRNRLICHTGTGGSIPR